MAGVAMVLDHCGVISGDVNLRIFGRIAAPLYGLSYGGNVQTALIVGIAAQIPYMLCIQNALNFALVLGLVEVVRQWAINQGPWRWWLVGAIITVLGVWPVDGLGLAVGTAISRSAPKKDHWIYYGGISVAAACAGHWLNVAGLVAGYSLVAVPLPEVGRMPKPVWRWLYPVHLAILAGVVVLGRVLPGLSLDALKG
jgi:hypothetical protein